MSKTITRNVSFKVSEQSEDDKEAPATENKSLAFAMTGMWKKYTRTNEIVGQAALKKIQDKSMNSYVVQSEDIVPVLTDEMVK